MFLLSSDERSVRKALDMRIRSLYLHRRLIVLIKMAIFLVVIVLSILFINSEIKNVFIKFSKSQEEKKIMKDLEIDQLLPPEEVELPPMPGFEKVERHPDTVYMSTTICGDRIEQAIIMIKSAIALCRNPLHIILMTEDHLRDPIEEAVNSWSQDSMKHVTFEYHGIMYPDWLNVSEWKWLYSLCSTHKIFLPSSLRHIDAVVLADTDVLFLRPVTEFYNHIRRFRPENVMGLAIESPAPRTGWYPSHRINIPIYKDQGLNGGVWLMNLTRLRQFRFERRIHAVYEKYKERDLFYGDQDIVSIFFSYYPDRAYVYPCNWNFRTSHCNADETCDSAEREGVALLHGISSACHILRNKEEYLTSFGAPYDVYHKYQLGMDLKRYLLEPMKESIKQLRPRAWCYRAKDLLAKGLENYLQELVDEKLANSSLNKLNN